MRELGGVAWCSQRLQCSCCVLQPAAACTHPSAIFLALPTLAACAGFPFCFKTCGLGLAVLLVLVTLAAAELSMRLLASVPPLQFLH